MLCYLTVIKCIKELSFTKVVKNSPFTIANLTTVPGTCKARYLANAETKRAVNRAYYLALIPYTALLKHCKMFNNLKFKVMKKENFHKHVTLTMDAIEWLAIANNIAEGAWRLRDQGYLYSSKDAMDSFYKILNAVYNQIDEDRPF